MSDIHCVDCGEPTENKEVRDAVLVPVCRLCALAGKVMMQTRRPAEAFNEEQVKTLRDRARRLARMVRNRGDGGGG